MNTLKLFLFPLAVLALCVIAKPLPLAAADGPMAVGKLVGLPVIGDDKRPLGDVDDVLIAFDGRITDFIVNLTGEKREGERVRLPFADVALDRDPAQIESTGDVGSLVRFPGPVHGTLGGIKAALLSYLIGAPAKTQLGERVGEVVGLGATADGQIVDVTLAQGGDQLPLPWSFVDIRAEKSTYPTEREIDPVVVVDRPA